ncbi:MAG: GNAT family N-acetyltransferase [Devosia sp.]
MTGSIRLRKHLSSADQMPSWPSGIYRVPIADVDPNELYALLSATYATGAGTLPPRAEWWPGITSDEEYDPALVFIAVTSSVPVGLALCWNSSFVKDVAVSAHMRGRGIGEALLRTAFAALRQRGFAHVDLKVVADNTTAIRLYRRLGMIEAAL